MNRAIDGETIFWDDDDYAAFMATLIEVQRKVPLRILAFCLMPNHFHLLVWPRTRDELPRFMHLVTALHARRWRQHRESTGRGHVYQGRYRASIVQPDDLHILRCWRYVERNALRANLVGRAADWRWGSLWLRLHGDVHGVLSAGPVRLPTDWESEVDEPQSQEEIEAIRRAATRSAPYGEPGWVRKVAAKLGLLHTLRSRGRPARRR